MFYSLCKDAVFLVFDILPMADVVKLRCTCRAADILFAQYVGNRLRIALRRVVADVDGLLQEMATTSTIIGGSTALAVVGRCSWVAGNLDLYTPHSYFSHVISYLTQVAHCRVTFDHLRGALDDQVEDVGCYMLQLRAVSGYCVTVVRSPGECPLQPLRSFWTTALMCYVSASSFCIAYPGLADFHRAVLRPTRLLDNIFPANRVLALILKYEKRGIHFRTTALSWERETDLSSDCLGPRSAHCALSLRYFGDRHCLTATHLSLIDPRPLPPPLSYTNILTLAWWEGGLQCGDYCIGHGETTEPQQNVLATTVLPERGLRL